jgi:hypothetical protein
MADLLECLVQIKALRDALEGVASLSEAAPSDTDARGDWNRMAGAERRYASALGAAAHALPSPGDDAGEARRSFAALRQANLALLERCTASRLAAEIAWPGRRSTTVADLVAIMLAHDTEVLARLRGRRASPIPPLDAEGAQQQPRAGAEQRGARDGEHRRPDDHARPRPGDGGAGIAANRRVRRAGRRR